MQDPLAPRLPRPRRHRRRRRRARRLRQRGRRRATRGATPELLGAAWRPRPRSATRTRRAAEAASGADAEAIERYRAPRAARRGARSLERCRRPADGGTRRTGAGPSDATPANAAIAAYREAAGLLSSTELRGTATAFLRAGRRRARGMQRVRRRGPGARARSSPAAPSRRCRSTDGRDDTTDDDVDHDHDRARTASERGPSSRREALRLAAIGAGAVAAAGLARPALAAGPGARRRGPARLPRRGDRARAAHRARLLDRGRRDGGTEQRAARSSTFATRSRRTPTHCGPRSTRSASTLPTPPDSTTDSAVFEDVDGLSAEAAERLIDLLEELDGARGAARAARLAAQARAEQLALYIGQGARRSTASTWRPPAPRSPAARPSTWSCSSPSSASAPRGGRRGGAGDGGRRGPGRLGAVSDALEPRPASASRSELVRWMGIERRELGRLRPRRRGDEDVRRGRRDRRDPALRRASSPRASTG